MVTLNKTWIPGYETIGGGDATVSIKSLSNYDDEIERLYELCEGITPPRPEIAGIDVPSFNVWNCHIPYIVVIIILVLIGLYILSTAYTIFFIRLNKEWNISVRRSDATGGIKSELNDDLGTPFEVSSTIDKRPIDAWKLSMVGKKYNPIFLFWKKSGYYIKIDSSDIFLAELMDPDYPKDVIDTIPVNKYVFLFSKRKVNNVILRINYKNNAYKIELS